MSKVAEVETIPTLKGFLPNEEMKRIWPSSSESQYVPCPFCGRLHRHGKLPGTRVPHCPRNRPEEYNLEIAGEITPEEFIELDAEDSRSEYRSWVCYTEKTIERMAERDAAELRRFIRRRRKEIAEIDKANAGKTPRSKAKRYWEVGTAKSNGGVKHPRRRGRPH